MKTRISSILAAIGLVLAFAFPAATPASAAPQLLCSYVVSGSSTSTLKFPQDCGASSLLGSGYHNIRILFTGACDSTIYYQMGLKYFFNDDTNSNYIWHRHYSTTSGTSTQGTGNTKEGSGWFGAMACRYSAGYPHGAGTVEAIIGNGDNTTFDKQVVSQSTLNAQYPLIEYTGSTWLPSTAAAITSITIFTQTGANWIPGSRFDIYIE